MLRVWKRRKKASQKILKYKLIWKLDDGLGKWK